MSQSNKLITFLAVFGILIAIPAIVLSRRPKQSSDKVTRLAIMAMQSDLRGLIMAEEATKQIRGRYVASAEDAGHISSPGVTAPLIVLSDTGWAATVQSKTIPGIRCAVGVFNTNPIKRFAKSGEIACE
jgi:hypothetical protein